MDKNKEKAIKKVKDELKKIEKNENSVYFFVIDTKGNPSGSLEYIYNLALIAKNEGFNVGMLHQEDDFVGVRDWLGDEYADLPHMSELPIFSTFPICLKSMPSQTQYRY